MSSSNSILNYSGSLRSGLGGGGVLTSSNISSTISVAIFNANLFLTYFWNSFLPLVNSSSINEIPVNFKLGNYVKHGGSHFNSHSSLNTPAYLDRKLNTNLILSPGFITF